MKVKDRYPDAKKKGNTPGYADITWAAVEDLGKNVRLVIALHDELPRKMPDETTYMIVSWNLSGDSKRPTRGFSVQAGPKGWTAEAGGNEGTVRYPGTLAVDGNTIELKFPWSFLGGRRDFSWSASSTWGASGGKKPASSEDTAKGRFRLK